MTALITCALGANAYRLKRQLSDQNVILGDYAEVPDVMIKSAQIIKLPSPERTAYQHEMLALCLDWGIDMIFPLSELERIALSEAIQLFAEYGIIIEKVPDGI